MNKNLIVTIAIVVIAVIVVGFAAFFISEKVIGREEPTTISSELVEPDAVVPTDIGLGSEADATDIWQEGVTLVAGITIETTNPEMPDVKPGEVETLVEPSVLDSEDIDSQGRPFLLLNASRKLPVNYVPHLEEVMKDSGIYLEAAAAQAFLFMYEDALSQGLTLLPVSGYVSYERQQKNYDDLTDQYINMGYSRAEAQALAARKVLPAGCSEHNAGLAVDFAADESFKDSAAYKWLARNAANYGFIERYTAEWEAETGMEANPGHWRYVGSAAVAKAIVESGMSFEEWMDSEYYYWEEPETEEPEENEGTTQDEAGEIDLDAEQDSTAEAADVTEKPEPTSEVVIDLDA